MERLDIAERKKEMELNQTECSDFVGTNPRVITPETLLTESGWFPYAYDGTDFTFTRTSDVDLATVPFVYVTQYNEATEIATVSGSEFLELVASFTMPDVVMIYSIGRCGTTLANHVLNASDEIWCLSEPDVLDQVAVLGNAELVQAMVKFLFAKRSKPQARALGIKLRSQSLFDAEKLDVALPDAKNVFMYRDAINWGNSFYTVIGKMEVPDPYPPEIVRFAWEIMIRETLETASERHTELSGATIEPSALFAHLWQRHMERYAQVVSSGMKMHPIRYNEFNQDRAAGVVELFEACGLDQIPADRALAAFTVDSQKGTFMGRIEKPQKMTDAQKDEMRHVLAKHPTYGSTDHILS